MSDSDTWAAMWLKRRRGALTVEEAATQVLLLDETQSLSDTIVQRRNAANDRWQEKQSEMFGLGISDKSQRWADERDAHLATMEDLSIRQKAVTKFTQRLSQ